MNAPPEDDLDARLDDRLRAAFVPPPAAALAAAARRITRSDAPSGTQSGVWRRMLPWVLAAAALLVTIAFAASRPRRGPEGHDGHELGAMWAAAYEHALSEGFGGGSCCAPDVDLAQLCEEKFTSKLGLGPAGSVKLLGCYCGEQPTGGCMALLARTDGDPVAVYVLPCSEDPRPVLPPGSPLHLARREMGPLVLYALSQSVAAETLGEFVVP